MISRVALITPPNEKMVMRDMYSSTISKGSYCWPNVDLLCLSGSLRNEFQTILIDANAERLSSQSTLSRLIEFQPDALIFALGESVKDSDLAFIAEAKGHQDLNVKKIVGTGGTLLHDAHSELRNSSFCDAIVSSYVTDDIVKYLKNDLSDLNNMVCRVDGEIVTYPILYPNNGFSVPAGLHEDLNPSVYSLPHAARGPVTSIATGYGCPYTCSFCVSSRINFRYRLASDIMKELKVVSKLGYRTVFFRDNVFGVNKRQLLEICEGIIDSKLDIEWVTDTRVDLVDKNLVGIMREAGCRALHFGLESANQITLDSVRKKLETDRVYSVLDLCEKAGINTIGYFILGLPGETPSDVRATIDYAKKLPLSYASFNLPIPIIGTDMRDEALKSGSIDNNVRQYDGSKATSFCSGAIDPKELSNFRDLAYKEFYFRPSFVYKFLTRIGSWRQVFVGLREFFLLLRPRSR
jgi:MoaA/NifB/PqqE/SkfB family radical SAM enzyme